VTDRLPAAARALRSKAWQDYMNADYCGPAHPFLAAWELCYNALAVVGADRADDLTSRTSVSTSEPLVTLVCPNCGVGAVPPHDETQQKTGEPQTVHDLPPDH
jgi:hypothetical protein